MAAIVFIVGSIIGWIAAAIALIFGALASTALIVFLATSLGSALCVLYLCAAREEPSRGSP